MELDELQQAFREKALVDQDTAAGGLLIKVAERRTTLLGLNPPIGHAVQVIQHAPAEKKKTSTQEMRDLLDDIMGITLRERQLLDRRELDGDESSEVLVEINELRAARGQRFTWRERSERCVSAGRSTPRPRGVFFWT